MIRSASSVYLESLGEQLEVVDQGLHRGLHLSSAGGHTLGVISPHVTCNTHLMTIIIMIIFLTIPLYPGDVEGLQHQWENQPNGDPRPATHASLLEG